MTPPASSFDPAGMTVTAVYDDGTTEEVTGYSVSPEKMEEDTRAVTVTYNGFTDELAVGSVRQTKPGILQHGDNLQPEG